MEEVRALLQREIGKEGKLTASGYGTVICYDVPISGIRRGRGQQPHLHLHVISKLEGEGRVERLQNSVLLVKDPVALQFIMEALERVGARYLLVEGRITGTLLYRRGARGGEP